MLKLSASAAQITAEWIGLGYGDWTNSANWKNGVVPVKSLTDQYNVILDLPNPSDFTQSALTDPMAVSQFTLGNALYVYSASGSGSVEFDVLDNFDWVGGSLSGWAAQYHLYGEALFEGNTSKTLDGTCTLTLHGHARWTQGNLAWGGYGQVTLKPGALFECFTGGTVGSVATTDSAGVNNLGTIRMNAPGQLAGFYGPVHNSGLLDAEAGDLQFVSTYDGAGAITVQSGARVIFSGPGQWQTVPQAGAGELVFSGGDQQLPSDTSFSCFTRVAANFLGSGNLTLSNAVWQGGQISGSGSLILPPGGNLAIQGRSAQLSRNLVNAGDITLSPGAWLCGNSAPVHTNSTSGEIHLSSASSFGLASSPAGLLVNRGSIFKDDAALGPAGFYATIQNQGLIRSMAGRLTLAPSGTNSGRLEALGPGQIEADGFDFADSSALVGDGQISLVGGTLRGSVDTNLNLATSGGVTVLGTNFYSLKTLQAGGWLSFLLPAGAEVREFLTLNGSLYSGVLRSLHGAELSFTTAQIKGGSRLELLGESALVQGSLTLQDTNSTLLNSGTMHLTGTSDVLVNPGATFLNQGTCGVSARMGSFKAILSDKVCRFTTANASSNVVFGDGPFLLSGPVVSMPLQMTAGPGARLCFSDFAMTNACLWLSQSSLAVTTNLSSSNATIVLDQGAIIGPAAPWKGSALFMGQGTVEAPLALQTLQLNAASNINDIILNGPLTVAGTNALLRTTVVLVQGVPVFPHLQVFGPVTLNARFDLLAPFVPGSSSLALGPVTLVESDQPITGAFLNGTNGATLSTATNSFRFQLWYGPDSPFGANKVVLTEFGTAFDRWRMHNFTAAQLLDPLVSGPAADPDRNGFNNLTEFVLAIEPGTQATSVPSVLPGPKGYTTLHLRKRKDAGGLQATIAVSPNLLTWQATPLGASPAWMELHRAFDLGDCYDYTYLYPDNPSELFLKVTVTGQY